MSSPDLAAPLGTTGPGSAAAGAGAVTPHEPGRLEAHLRERREAGFKLVVPYITGGLGDDWIDTLRAVAAAGADAIEVGIPFSDPVMDGPTIQEASQRSLESGTTPLSILDSLRRVEVEVPIAVMTYYNIVARAGHRRMASELAEAGVSGAILPDLPVDESAPWTAAADEAGVETVLLAAPTTPDERLRLICGRSRGFLYAVGLLGVTGERSELADSALTIARRCKAATDVPVLVGVGVSNAEQARAVCQVADGVVVGSALVRRLLDGAGPEGAAAFVAELRAGVDEA
ncbi:MAG: trpA [Acidimicrobiaceae bacterium]|nr:trpA [Acidimicrobiaceae bacterium]